MKRTITTLLILTFALSGCGNKLTTNNLSIPKSAPATKTQNKCFANDGQKYRTSVKLQINADNKISGTVVSDEYDETPIEKASFTGTKIGNTFKVKFSGKPPVVGASSEWTEKVWTLKEINGVETLVIIFNAKNYDTNKWSNTSYEFVPCN
jgi:hypothetical protein